MSSILVVEDDYILRYAITRFLRHAGYEVVEATNGLEAINLLENIQKPCVIILDLMMPVMSGLQFRAEQLRRPDFADIPVIVTTGHDDAANLAMNAGAHSLLRKPFRPHEMIDLTRRLCQ